MALTLQDVLERTSTPAPPPLSRDEALAALSRAKRQTRHRPQLFRQIHADRSRRVMTVAIDISTGAVTQARGRFNANPDRHVAWPHINPQDGGGDRRKGRLSSREQELLAQSHHILRLWLDRENIAYSKLDL